MAKFVDADTIHKLLKQRAIDEFSIDADSGYEGFLRGFMAADDIVRGATNVDIVRCRNCRFYYETSEYTLCTIKFEPEITDPDWFCAGGLAKDVKV